MSGHHSYIKNHLLGGLAALSLAVASSASAQTQQPGTSPAGSGTIETTQSGQGMPVQASQIMDQAVHGTADKTIGDIEDIILASDGRVTGVVIKTGTVLGMGGRSVMIDWERLNITSQPGQRQLQISVNMTEEELKALPEFDAKTFR